MKLTLGEMLYRFQIERGLLAQEICAGLCSPSNMSYYESNEL